MVMGSYRLYPQPFRKKKWTIKDNFLVVVPIWSAITFFLAPQSVFNNEEPVDESDAPSWLPSVAGDFQASRDQL